MQRILKSKKGQSLNLIGIIACILVFDIGVIFFAGVVGADINDKQYNIDRNGITDNNNPFANCDCGVITCNEYKLLHGEQDTRTLCEAQLSSRQSSNSSFGVDILTGIGNYPIVTGIIIILNIIVIVGTIRFALGSN